ncbi:MAG: hypothetical protein KDC38_12100 [Planctomycetes bacterium]|nr:hypothetical protein [Planctomycetota bacterium]
MYRLALWILSVSFFAPTIPVLVAMGEARSTLAGGIGIHSEATLTPEQRAVLSYISLVTVRGEGGESYPTLRITGANLQVVNGLGSTNGNPVDPDSLDPHETQTDGTGNIIVGYNESAPGYAARRGSHNVIVGSKLAYTRFGGIVVGRASAIQGAYATVTGGRGRAMGDHSSIAGGEGIAVGEYSTIAGGVSGVASGDGATVSGGDNNEASGPQSSVVGGEGNVAGAYSSVVVGGNGNVAEGMLSVVSAGEQRHAIGTHAWIACDLESCP